MSAVLLTPQEAGDIERIATDLATIQARLTALALRAALSEVQRHYVADDLRRIAARLDAL